MCWMKCSARVTDGERKDSAFCPFASISHVSLSLIPRSLHRRSVDSFRSYGFRVCLDDFGSRYANLSLFTNVTFDTVKLDRSLITQLADNEANRMLVKDLVQIGKGRGMRCVAEGVETQEQIRALLEIGCNYAQGYYYDKPMNAQDFREKYLLKRKTD